MTAPTRMRRSSATKAAGRKEVAHANPVEESEVASAEALAPLVEPAGTRRSGSGKGRTTAAERAYARRAQRAELLSRPETAEKPSVSKPGKFRLSWPKSRASFVLIMMSLLAAGVATTLWLSTQAIADSYQLERVKQDNATLAERAEQLQRNVAQQESIASLAQKAKELGMVPGGDPARILSNSDGSTTLFGEPKAAVAPPPPPPPPVQTPPATPTMPIEGDVAANPDQPDAQAPAGQQLPPEQNPVPPTTDAAQVPAGSASPAVSAPAGASSVEQAPPQQPQPSQPQPQQAAQQGPILGGN